MAQSLIAASIAFCQCFARRVNLIAAAKGRRDHVAKIPYRSRAVLLCMGLFFDFCFGPACNRRGSALPRPVLTGRGLG
ncbi:hypothetical protein GGD63_007671 [Bradyrhizobium sp. cir1]|nr:hypothetical protein [Bradyrhizobium sp. cir1]